MRSRIFWLIAGVVLFCCVAYATEDMDSTPPVVDKKTKNVTAPASDRPTPEEVTKLKGCNSVDLYYGIGAPADPVAARKCAFLEQAKGERMVSGGSMILMMVYANGAGVERNFDLSLHYSSRLDEDHEISSVAYKNIRLHLEKLKAEKWAGNDFDFCEFTTSGYMLGYCAYLKARLMDQDRNVRILKIASTLKPEHQHLFDALEQASEKFTRTRTAKETCLMGTAATAVQMIEEQKLKEDYVQMLEAFAGRRERRYSIADYTDQSAKLDKILGRIANTPNDQKVECSITMSGIKRTQKAWEAYRDAFAQYASARYPRIAADSVKTWLIVKRIHTLRALILTDRL
jgi:hypothetical protein